MDISKLTGISGNAKQKKKVKEREKKKAAKVEEYTIDPDKIMKYARGDKVKTKVCNFIPNSMEHD